MRSLLGDLIPAATRIVAAAAPATTRRSPLSYARQSAARLPLFHSGQQSQELEAMTAVPTLFACVERVATAVAEADWTLYLRSPTGRAEDRVPVVDHPALDLWEHPNPYMTRADFVETAAQHFELTGEQYWAIGRDDRAPGLPLSLWPVPPNRMEPVPDARRFRAGFIYLDPDGRQVPFDNDSVIYLRKPDPTDPYRGLGPVRPLLVDLESSHAAASWNRAFFRNSAEPGGIIYLDDPLSDDDFDQLTARWNESHRGTANAHRVAVLDRGMKWASNSFSMRDLQFVELSRYSDERIMLGFGLSKTLLGQTEAVNRATAEAAEYVFGKYQLRPRLRRIRAAINQRIVPAFAYGDLMEFDFEDPVTGNEEQENASRDSRVQAAVQLIGAGFDPDDVAEAFDLPEMRHMGRSTQPVPDAPATAPALPPAAEPDDDDEDDDRDAAELAALVAAAVRRAGPPPTVRHPAGPVRPRGEGDPPDLDSVDLPPVDRLQEAFEDLIEDLVDEYASIEADQKAELVDRVLAAATAGSLSDLADLVVDTAAAVALLERVMTAMFREAATATVDEAADQGVTLEPAEPDSGLINEAAVVVAALTASRLVNSATSTAMRANGDGVTATEVADAVEEALGSLSIDGPRPQLAGALTGTQNEARLATYARGPRAAFYSNEVNDTNTCGPCRAVDGKWLGNTEDLAEIRKLYPGGAYGGYVDCDGRERCRGTISAIYWDGNRRSELTPLTI